MMVQQPPAGHLLALSESGCQRTMRNEQQLSTVFISKAVIPLSADGVEKIGLEDVVRS
jgi:hypothetical protein